MRTPVCRFLLATLLVAAVSAPALAAPGGRIEVSTVDGRRVAPIDDRDAAAVVLVFVEALCPIANRYAPEIDRLIRAWTPRRVRFWLVYPDPTTTPEIIRVHRRAYGLHGEAVLDPDHALVRAAGATVTPEAAVFVDGERRYNGRIDDRARDFGVFAPAPSERTLDLAIGAVLARRSVARTPVPGVGCVIADLVKRD